MSAVMSQTNQCENPVFKLSMNVSSLVNFLSLIIINYVTVGFL